MPTIAAINARCATLPPRGQLSNAELRTVNEAWGHPLARVAADFQALLNTQTSEMVNSVLRGMGSVAGHGGIAEQANAAVRQLALAQTRAASHAAGALNAGNVAAWQEAANSFGLSGGTAIADGAKYAFDMLSAVERMKLPSDLMATSLASVMTNAATLERTSALIRSYPLPSIHIHHAPPPFAVTDIADVPADGPHRPRRLGRPRGSFRLCPEFVVLTYERLARTGYRPTQQQLADELNVPFRTLQRWFRDDQMALGWPPKP